MDTNNSEATTSGEATIVSDDLTEQRQFQLQPESRQRIVTKITDTLKKHLPVHGHEGLNELRMIAVRFEEKIYAIATSQGIKKCWYSIVWMFVDTNWFTLFELSEENISQDDFTVGPASDCLYCSEKKEGDGSLTAVETISHDLRTSGSRAVS
ncbi:hypothetical protein CRYUN_Cryun37aG0026300 [Craigia yunnanensis]